LARNWPDVANATAKADSYACSGFHPRDEWPVWVSVEIEIVENPKVIAWRLTGPHPGGHHCFFTLGAGKLPGVDYSKQACVLLCGAGSIHPQRGTAFIDAPALDKLIPPKVACKDGGTGRPLTEYETYKKMGYTVEQLRPKALRGDLLAMRNLAYQYAHGEGADARYDVRNPMLACVWRLAILLSGNEGVDDADIGYKNIFCRPLSNDQRVIAAAQAESFARGMKPK
jgi:hypothetical protein